MSYFLLVLTDGRPGLLTGTLASFWSAAEQLPYGGAIIDDSGSSLYASEVRDLADEYGLDAVHHPERLGFCAAVRAAWKVAAARLEPYVFWLEDDFEFDRSVDVAAMEAVLAEHPSLAQMALMRHPVNATERQAGGLFRLHRDRYEPRDGWVESRASFTTNCSLIPTEFMRANPWPDYPEECEGRFSIDLLQKGYLFGVWGDGDPWITHTGHARAGFGY